MLLIQHNNRYIYACLNFEVIEEIDDELVKVSTSP